MIREIDIKFFIFLLFFIGKLRERERENNFRKIKQKIQTFNIEFDIIKKYI